MNELLFLVFYRLGPTQNFLFSVLCAFFFVSDYEWFEPCEQQRKKKHHNSFQEIANLEVIKKETFVNCH